MLNEPVSFSPETSNLVIQKGNEGEVHMISTFRGGIHPDDGKALARNDALTVIEPSGTFVFPLSMHIGAPANPIVAKGDHVERGQMIAEAGGFVSSPIYSSISGTVKSIEPRAVATGGTVNAVIIEPDEEQGAMQTLEPMPDWKNASREELIGRIKDAGIVGMGGAGFPTHVKLSPKEPDKIEYIIANCAECEPYITADFRRMYDYTEEILEGMRIILSLFPGAKGIVAIEDNKPENIKDFKDTIGDDPVISVRALQTKYPQGAERQLIYVTTGRALNSDMLPADVGAIVDNCETLYAIEEAVVKGIPLTSRTMTISGDAIQTPGNYIVPIGLSQNKVIEAAGGWKTEPKKMISGGPMMGFAMATSEVPVTKTSSALLGFTRDIVSESPISPCINCGRCVENCPSRILPSRLAKLADRGDMEGFQSLNGMECCECGCCSYVCPAKRQLKQSIASMRKIVLGERKKQQLAAQKAKAEEAAKKAAQEHEADKRPAGQAKA